MPFSPSSCRQVLCARSLAHCECAGLAHGAPDPPDRAVPGRQQLRHHRPHCEPEAVGAARASRSSSTTASARAACSAPRPSRERSRTATRSGSPTPRRMRRPPRSPPIRAYDPVKDFAPVAHDRQLAVRAARRPEVAGNGRRSSSSPWRRRSLAPSAMPRRVPPPWRICPARCSRRWRACRLVHVPYRGTGQSVVDLMESRIELLFGTIAPSLAHVRNGKMRALATTGEQAQRHAARGPDHGARRDCPATSPRCGRRSCCRPAHRHAIIERLNRELVAVRQFAGDARGARQAGRRDRNRARRRRWRCAFEPTPPNGAT